MISIKGLEAFEKQLRDCIENRKTPKFAVPFPMCETDEDADRMVWIILEWIKANYPNGEIRCTNLKIGKPPPAAIYLEVKNRWTECVA